MTTTTVDTQVIAAGSGGTSTPVKLTLQGGTKAVSTQLKVTTVRAAAPGILRDTGKNVTMFWAFSPDDLTLANVPTLLRHCAKSQKMTLNNDIETAGQRQQSRDSINGQYMYLWFEYSASVDQRTIVLQVTEEDSAGAVSGGATAANQATEIASLASIDGKLVAGPSTAAKQDTGNTSLASIDTKTPALASGRQPVEMSEKQSNGAPSTFTTITATGDVFTLAAGEVGFIQNTGTNPLLYCLKTGASATVLNGVLAAGTANDDGLGDSVYIKDYIGVVSVFHGTAVRCLAWKRAI